MCASDPGPSWDPWDGTVAEPVSWPSQVGRGPLTFCGHPGPPVCHRIRFPRTTEAPSPSCSWDSGRMEPASRSLLRAEPQLRAVSQPHLGNVPCRARLCRGSCSPRRAHCPGSQLPGALCPMGSAQRLRVPHVRGGEAGPAFGSALTPVLIAAPNHRAPLPPHLSSRVPALCKPNLPNKS